MNNQIEQIKNVLSQGFKKDVFLKEKRPNLYQLFIPFFYPDGDMIEVFLRLKDDSILIEDLGMAVMRLSYHTGLKSKTKKRIFHEILSNYQVSENNGCLSLTATKKNLFPSVMQFVQVIIKISDIEYLRQEVAKNLFYEYFDNFILNKLKDFNPQKNFYPDFDKEKQYSTPYVVLTKNATPVCFYPISSDDKAKEVTIIIQHYETHNFKPDTIAVFENQVDISRKPLARLTNVVGKQFSTLEGNENRIKEYTQKVVYSMN